ncbi:guanosine-5'-triphosphate,3'-diphosphate pyrophosphatase [Brumicola pallidula]|uniref:Guanosine-5'-triphosphate,3'-diphosphate pyrophosphatase n=1 Tax=Brumicola pallidula DSM 14239 = ACAM 615 TaxID=1121922 RepID=K6YY57_9ALTE|nr:guanosine-5'-triphosphate,3'-diphosphate pyrophosphatase [Glaciecola pallidula]GAC28876.1 guanosine-5'-triphosphate,3'-diphosphate pyrophosphatase [Glaciecola pallidula DSM 14239 = ACAM 615]
MIQEVPNTVIQDEYYAAVDLGSNSFHMVIVRVLSGSVQIVSKNKRKVRLAAGLDDDFNLSEESIQRGLECLKTFREQLDDIPKANIKVVATATLRIANNAADFVTRGERILNHKINVISGEEEARQIYLGVAYTSANQGNTLVVDIGGASTEVIVGRDMQPLHLNSVDMGCVTFMERYFKGGLINKENFEHALAAAEQMLVPYAATFKCFDWQQCLGASGTPQAVVSILVKQGINDAIRLDYLYQLRDQAVACQHIDSLQIDGLADSRKLIFPAGLAILIALFKQLNLKNMQISGGALREGMIYGMLDNYQRADRRTQGINQLVSRFHVDTAQSDRVRKVAMALSRQMCAQSKFCDFDTEALISSAAALHELGLHIGYKKFHEHGAYILTHVELTGFTTLQRMFIRDLVGMHRQDIDLTVFNNYQEDFKEMLVNALRIVRISVILCTRRRDDTIPSPNLTVSGDDWHLHFGDGVLLSQPLVHAEVIHETWLQHKAGWKLACE